MNQEQTAYMSRKYQSDFTSTTPASVTNPLAAFQTTDGGARQGDADLWCTYAATRTLKWLQSEPGDVVASVQFLELRRSFDGGYAWQKGLPSDIWATYYCSQALTDTGQVLPKPDDLSGWLNSLQNVSGGFAMRPGFAPDVWATYYAVRTFHQIADDLPPHPARLQAWLTSLQTLEGGLTWSPGNPHVDVRACYYGAVSRSYLQKMGIGDAIAWDEAALIDWIQAQQQPDGGFVFYQNPAYPVSCLWATFRAVRALHALGAEPLHSQACVDWIYQRFQPDETFTRWPEYPTGDVWACFCAVGALQTLGAEIPVLMQNATVQFLQNCQIPDSGFTYRQPDAAGDSLATCSVLMLDNLDDKEAADTGYVDWLHRAHLPAEDGVMYMPARGAEVRCTLWAVAALHLVDAPSLDEDRLLRWFQTIQNTDGGFGYWHGRGSDMTATISALECLDYLYPARRQSAAILVRARQFLQTRCADLRPGEPPLTLICQASRGLSITDDPDKARGLAASIVDYQSRLGGYGATARSLPDLISTYQAILTYQHLNWQWDADLLATFLERIRLSNGFAWTPLGKEPGGLLAMCLARLLAQLLDDPDMFLPRLNL
jgi:hypothetical protein